MRPFVTDPLGYASWPPRRSAGATAPRAFGDRAQEPKEAKSLTERPRSAPAHARAVRGRIRMIPTPAKGVTNHVFPEISLLGGEDRGGARRAPVGSLPPGD